MTDRSRVRNFLFKGIALEARLDELEHEGISIRHDTEPGALQRVLPLEDFSPDVRRRAIRSLPAYLAFFCLENSARELIADRLSENHKSDWWKKCVPNSVRNGVADRQEKEEADRWHMQRGASEIYYTNFGDLTAIVRNNWSDFEDLFPDQNWIMSRFGDLEKSRNIIAHNNVLDDREIDRIRMYLDDWIRQVG